MEPASAYCHLHLPPAPATTGDATKNWVDANIQISPLQDSNAIGDSHTLTGHVNVNPGTGFVNAPDGTTINFAIASGPGSLSAASCLTSGGTGSCSVTLTSNATGVTTVNASTAVTVGGVVLNRTTNGSGGNSGPAVKNWVDANRSARSPTRTR